MQTMNLIGDKMPETIKYSEMFFSPQGEGKFAGQLTAWVRFFMCNLKCEGFSQPDPTNPKTYIREWQQIDVSNVTDINDLPVLSRGCDSIYSHRPEFKDLALVATPSELCDSIENLLPGSKFANPSNYDNFHMAFTGGEPMMSQKEMVS